MQTVYNIDKGSKQILFNHFTQENVNKLASRSESLVDQLNKLNKKKEKNLINNEKLYESDSSRNHSELDEVNQIHNFK